MREGVAQDVRQQVALSAEIIGLWRYPVQSLRGEQLTSLDIGPAGVIGDRGYAMLDPVKGKLVGSSRPGWDALITWSARYLGPVLADGSLPPVAIQFPGGASVCSDDPECDHKLSAELGKEIRLVLNDGRVAEPRYALAPCHFLTTATLAKLREIYPGGTFDPARFRPNLLLECEVVPGFIEQDWIGVTMRSGEVELRVTEDCVRCAMTVRAQGNLPKDPKILHAITQHNNTNCGGYATVNRTGQLLAGSALSVGD